MSGLRATDVIRIAFIHDASELEDATENKYFHPLFAHQIYTDEVIEGHTKPTVDLIFSAVDLQLCLVIGPDPTNDSKVQCTDLMQPWVDFIKHPFSQGLNAVRETLAKSKGFHPPGEKEITHSARYITISFLC